MPITLQDEQVTELSRLVEVDSFESPEAMVKALTDEIHTLRSDNVKFLDERDNAVAELSAAKAPSNKSDDDESEEIYLSRLEAREERSERLVSDGDMPKFICERIKKKMKEHAKPGAILLSRDKSTNEIPIDWFLSMFEGSKLGLQQRYKSQSGAQTTTLSRETPADSPSAEGATRPTGINPYEAEIQRVTAAK